MDTQKAIDMENLSPELQEFWDLYCAASPEKQRQVRIMLGLED